MTPCLTYGAIYLFIYREVDARLPLFIHGNAQIFPSVIHGFAFFKAC